MRAEGVQDLAGRHQLDPDPEPAGVPGGLVGGELGRAVRDPAAANAGLGAAGDAFLQVLSTAARPMACVSSDSGYG